MAALPDSRDAQIAALTLELNTLKQLSCGGDGVTNILGSNLFGLNGCGQICTNMQRQFHSTYVSGRPRARSFSEGCQPHVVTQVDSTPLGILVILLLNTAIFILNYSCT